jgi:hypothetical protein
MAGDSIGSPASTLPIAATISAGGVSLSRNPFAPAASARTTYSSASNVVNTITFGGSGSAVMAAVAAMPSITGMRKSIRTMSRPPPCAASTASRPFAASATTSMSGAPPSMRDRPARTSASSSVMRTRVMPATVARHSA